MHHFVLIHLTFNLEMHNDLYMVYILPYVNYTGCLLDRGLHLKYVCLYKCLHNLAPVYLTELYVSRQTHRAGLRSGNRNLLEVPKVKTKYYGERAFAYAGPTV